MTHHNDETWSRGFFGPDTQELRDVEQRYVDVATNLEAFVKNTFPEFGIQRIYFVKQGWNDWKLNVLHKDGEFPLDLKPNCGYFELLKTFVNKWPEYWLRGKTEDKEEE